MRNFLGCSMLMLLLAVGLPAVAELDYTFDSGTQGWTPGGAGVSNLAASGGILGFDYVAPSGDPLPAFDPMVISPASLAQDSDLNHWIVLRVNLTAATSTAVTFQIFFDNAEGGYSEPRSRTIDVTPNSGWQTVVFDMTTVQPSRTAAWTGNLDRVRIDPGGPQAQLVGYRCEFDRIMLTSDTDEDGITDDTEIDVFGDITTANGNSDYDSDGISDRKEIEFGLDPFVDEGVDLPATGVAGLVLLALGCAVLGTLVLKRKAVRA